MSLLFTVGNAGDMKRVGSWCRFVLGPITIGGTKDLTSIGEITNSRIGKLPILFGLFELVEHQTSWTVLVQSLSGILLKQASIAPEWVFIPRVAESIWRKFDSLIQVPLILEIIKLLCDANSYTRYKIPISSKVLEYLISRSYYSSIRDLITNIVRSPLLQQSKLTSLFLARRSTFSSSTRCLYQSSSPSSQVLPCTDNTCKLQIHHSTSSLSPKKFSIGIIYYRISYNSLTTSSNSSYLLDEFDHDAIRIDHPLCCPTNLFRIEIIRKGIWNRKDFQFVG